MISELGKAGLTILGGVTIFVLGQIVNSYFIKPVVELMEEIGRTFSVLVLYVDNFQPPHLTTVMTSQISDNLKIRASELMAKGNASSKSALWLYRLPNKNDLISAGKNILFLSNTLHEETPRFDFERVQRIETYLKIKLNVTTS